jgi:predicted metal-dependent hydrolase
MARTIQPRNPDLVFDASIPRHWFGGNAFGTHMVNGVNLLFPAGERFFVRSVRHFLDRVDDPELARQVRGFFGQEGRHAGSHERFFEALEAQGLDVKRFVEVYERIAYGVLEPRFSPEMRLAVTVALEHYTAIMAENALRERLLDGAHPMLARLLFWHASEEIEHKAVAFDVLARVNPSYRLRMAGMALATAALAAFWAAAVIYLLRQDGLLGSARVREERATIRRDRDVVGRVFVRGIREYARRDFHPSQNDNYHLAEDYLKSAGFAVAEQPA